MNSGCIYRRCAPATQQEISELLREHPGAPALRIQEKIDAVEFEKADGSWQKELPNGLWQQGRMFGPQAEIRWCAADGNGFDILLLSETKLCLPKEIWLEQEAEISQDYQLFLWGERSPDSKPFSDYWIETRIPQKLRYPIDEEIWRLHQYPFIAITARDFIINGIIQFTRLIELTPYKGI